MKDKIVFSTNPDFDYSENSDEEIYQIRPNEQNLRIWLENRPGNKVVSIIKNFKGTKNEIKQLEKSLKRQCGVGGSIKGENIIIQTKDRKKLMHILKKMGYGVKFSGG